MLLGLTTIWRDAVGDTSLKFYFTAGSLGIGLCASTLVAVVTIWFALRRQARQPAMAWLNAGGRGMRNAEAGLAATRSARRPLVIGVSSLVIALVMVLWAMATGETTNAEIFFSAGALVLIGGLALLSRRLQHRATAWPESQEPITAGGTALTAAGLALRGLARRRSRSVATAALLACGSFLILSIGVFRLDANRDATQPHSGTGGFALIGESTLPIAKDLNTEEGREFFALDPTQMEEVRFVQFRVRAGDEASCLNLSRAQQPRVMGVDPDAMDGRFTFVKVAAGRNRSEGWTLLSGERGMQNAEPHLVPAIGDLNSIVWAMGKKVGDTIDYTDQRGRPFKVQIVGAVANSILQGNLIIDEAEFVRRFPEEEGYRYLLMDAPVDRSAEVAASLSRAMEDYGLEITPAVDRLNQFNAVQNTYLGTFQIIGGLGLLLGSAGLGIVVLRNVLERRGELAVLMAVGFRKRRIERLVLLEHAGLLGLGLAVGLAASAVAVLPTLLSPGSHLPYTTLVPTLIGVLINGLIWTWIASRFAIRGNLLEALRNE
jgi:hypothetical protein